LKEQHEALLAAIAGGGTLFALTRGEITADLEAFKGGQALEWKLAARSSTTPSRSPHRWISRSPRPLPAPFSLDSSTDERLRFVALIAIAERAPRCPDP
jgi:hypothetical protein